MLWVRISAPRRSVISVGNFIACCLIAPHDVHPYLKPALRVNIPLPGGDVRREYLVHGEEDTTLG